LGRKRKQSRKQAHRRKSAQEVKPMLARETCGDVGLGGGVRGLGVLHPSPHDTGFKSRLVRDPQHGRQRVDLIEAWPVFMQGKAFRQPGNNDGMHGGNDKWHVPPERKNITPQESSRAEIAGARWCHCGGGRHTKSVISETTVKTV